MQQCQLLESFILKAMIVMLDKRDTNVNFIYPLGGYIQENFFCYYSHFTSSGCMNNSMESHASCYKKHKRHHSNQTLMLSNTE